ncbi:hybrid sensor histidine kinase/response regulator [Flavobacterium sp. W21_SRS_FM6]|uniref:hybrid sensor histidine kinase/response regulator n=1 Tax=Flavobacterium sp. W21_SRS_FM6 TaxID=3240268 RepID=UPI003F8FAE30
MGALIRAYDWSSTPLGPAETWPQPLKTSLRLLLSTGHPMLIWWGPDLIQFYNNAYARTLGPERHPSSLGQRGQECWSEIWSDVEPQITQVLTGKGHTWHENQLLRITRNGIREEMYWTYSYSPIDDPNAPLGVGGVLVICSETTQQVLAEQHMKAAEARWRALFDQAPSFMCILKGPEHRFEYANYNYLAILDQENILGKTVLEVIPEVRNQGFINLLDKVYQTGDTHHGVATPLKIGSGQAKYLDFIYQPILEPDGQITGVMVIGYDVSELVYTSQSLREEHRRKDEFLAMLAHELRNPLAPIRNLSEMLTQSVQQDSKMQNIGNILSRQCTQLTRLLDDLLDISRISHNRITLQFEALNIAHVLRLAIETLEDKITHKEHTIQFIDSPAPLFVKGDMTRLMQCFTNVLSNAIKYTAKGGKIVIQLYDMGDTVDITIADNGCGISLEMQEKVFELFVQSEQTLDRSQGGLGIGLNIVQRLVQMHDGKVSVSSDGLDCGSTFSISLPKIALPLNVEQPTHSVKNPNKRVLMVDDNKDAADTMAELLKLQGHEVITAYTARDALDYAESFTPEIILLDIGLPDMTGYEVAQAILNKNMQTSLTLVALTGYGQPEDVQRAKEAGFDFHFTKPVAFGDLKEVFSVPETESE